MAFTREMAEFATTWGSPLLAGELASQITCEEFATLHNLLATVNPEVAKMWAEAHAVGDYSEGDCRHAAWHALDEDEREGRRECGDDCPALTEWSK